VTSFSPAALPNLSVVHLLQDESGQDMIEYALVASFIGLGTVTGLHGLAADMSDYLNVVLNSFNSAIAGQS
jgi:pilus assembly protein Flp/PilA